VAHGARIRAEVLPLAFSYQLLAFKLFRLCLCKRRLSGSLLEVDKKHQAQAQAKPKKLES
jgi:hypothetical protein